jgi:hypothetical protein
MGCGCYASWLPDDSTEIKVQASYVFFFCCLPAPKKKKKKKKKKNLEGHRGYYLQFFDFCHFSTFIGTILGFENCVIISGRDALRKLQQVVHPGIQNSNCFYIEEWRNCCTGDGSSSGSPEAVKRINYSTVLGCHCGKTAKLIALTAADELHKHSGRVRNILQLQLLIPRIFGKRKECTHHVREWAYTSLCRNLHLGHGVAQQNLSGDVLTKKSGPVGWIAADTAHAVRQ